MLHLYLNYIMMHLWTMFIFIHPLVLRKLCSDVMKHNDKMPPFNIWHRTSIVKDFCRKEGDHVFWMKFLTNNLSYICSSFIYVFHDTKGYHNSSQLTTSRMWSIYCQCSLHGTWLNNHIKLADVKLLHHITIPESSILHYYCRSCL